MNINTDDLKKKIIYRSLYRGTKEMDFLLGSFVKKYIDSFNENELDDLLNMLDVDDVTLYNYNQNKKESIIYLLQNIKQLIRFHLNPN